MNNAIVQELLEQIKGWQREMTDLEDKIEEAYKRIDQLTEAECVA